ncbi:MAG: DUF2207 domain-containing protein [Mogibacterium sp.]|nr:DUF2207 domain-containing protein [Mogibacterium sp.]
MKKNKLILLLTAIMCFTILALPAGVFAASNFIIRNYNIRMVVNEDDTYEITETLDVEFTAPSHGIYVSIPRKTRLDRDGQLSQYNAAVKGFRMLSGQPFNEEKDGDAYLFRIGDPDKYADTETHYEYTYIYDTRGDHFKGGDEVYYNLVGTTWEAQSIDNASFEVVFPKDIDMSKVGIKTGDDVRVPFEAVDSRTIKGETNENVMGGLTVRAVLPEGYFTRQAKNLVVLFYIMTGGLALLAVFGFVLWRKYGKDPVYPVTEEFYPPDGLSAPEAAYLAKGSLNKQDVVSTLLSLADRGYLKIREFEEEKGIRKKKKTAYEIIRLREYDGDVVGEKTFMDGLFASGDVVGVKDLEDKFYKTIEQIEEEIRDKYDGMLYDETAAAKANIMYIAGWAGLAILTVVSKIAATGFMTGSLTALLMNFAPLVLFGLGFQAAAKAIRDKKRIVYYLYAVIPVALGWILAMATDMVYGPQMVPFAVSLLSCLILFILGGLCEKKTDFYAEIQSRIKGYTDFLKTAEKDQMEALAEQDPGYYYRNLAYAFALGVTAVYVKRFAAMAKTAPGWYDTHHYHGGFEAERLTDSLTGMMSSVSDSLSSSPSDGGGGGSFSGGGGGGGSGGGSW